MPSFFTARAGKSVKDFRREHGISDATFYNWKAKYEGIQVSDVKRMKNLGEENSRIKRIVADLILERCHQTCPHPQTSNINLKTFAFLPIFAFGL